MTLAASVYQRNGTLVSALPNSFARQFHDAISDTGGWSLSLTNDDAALANLVYGRVVRLSVDGTVRFAGLIERLDRTSVAPTEEVDQVTKASGRGTLAIFEEAVIVPSLGVDRLTFQDARLFNFAASGLDMSAWTAVTNHPQTGGTGGVGSQNFLLPRWPDPNSLKIWMTYVPGDRAVTDGDVYARTTFTTTSAHALYRVFASADDGYELWIDGSYVMGEIMPFLWYEFGTTEVTLDSGSHTIAMKGSNPPGLRVGGPGSDNVAWMMASVMETSSGGAALGAVAVNTSASWTGVGYPAVPPGFSPGAIVRILVAEAQARGALTGVTLGFSDTVDTAGTTWPIISDFAVQVGADMLTTIRQLCETYMDVHMDPSTLRLDAWVSRGATKAVTLVGGSNVTSLVHAGIG